MRRFAYPLAALLMAGCAQLGLGDQQTASIDTAGSRPLTRVSAANLQGMEVYGQSGEMLGEVASVVTGNDGRADRLILTSGGFLGFGGRQVALDADDVRVTADNQALIATDLTAAQLDRLPEVDDQGRSLSSQ